MKLLKVSPKKYFIGFGIFLISIAIVGFLFRAYLKIQSGHGLDYYFSGKGFQLNYIGVFILFLTIPVALGFGWIFGKYMTWRDKRIERQLIEERLSKIKSKRKKKS